MTAPRMSDQNVGREYYADPYYSSPEYAHKVAAAQETEDARQALLRGESTPETLAYARFLDAAENDATHSQGRFKAFRYDDKDVARKHPFLVERIADLKEQMAERME